MTDALGASSWAYDPNGRVTAQVDSLSQEIAYGYDPAGQLTSLTDPSGDVIEYSYDDAGHLAGLSSPWGSVTYASSPAGRLLDAARSDDTATTYAYDLAGQVTSIDHFSAPSQMAPTATPPSAAPQPSPPSQEATSCTSAAGYLENREAPRSVGCLEAVDYLTTRTVPRDEEGIRAGLALSLDYTYDAVGSVTSETRIEGARDFEGETTDDESVSGTTTERRFGYDALSRLVTSEGAAGEHTYAYDAGGNILRMTGPLGETIQSFNAANQLTTSSGTVDASYEYDAAGQRIAETTPDGTTTTGYTALGKVARIATPDRSADYGYDGLGRALTVTDASGAGQQTTTQAWDGLDVIGQSNDEHGTTAVVRDRVGQLVIEAGDDDDARWALLDRLGSVVGQVGGGRIEQLASYSDFGEQAFGTTGWDSETGFGGEQVNPELGVTNYYARTYDPSTGTWLSQDSWRGLLAQPQTLARYAFVENNPTTFLDDSGFCNYKGRESGCRSTIGGKTPKPSPGGSRGTGSLGASIGAGQPIGSISRPSPRGVPAAAAGMAASAPAPAAASASFIPTRHDRPSAATAPCLGLLPFSIIPGLSVLPFLACGAASANSRVDYTYSWDLGAADGMSPEDAMAIFQQRPDEIFPFLIDGCTTLTTGSTCDLHAFELRGSPDWASFVAGLVPNGHGTVSVTSTPTSVLFEVQSDGYFEQAGSTIEFTVIERDGHLHLVQTGHGVPDSLLTEIANDNDAPWPTWWLQRMRFRDVLDEYRP